MNPGTNGTVAGRRGATYHRGRRWSLLNVMESLRVLAIEDDLATLRMLVRGLSAHGFEVVGADRGERGARLAITEPVDLVLLDVMLPGLDGHQALTRIRAARPDLPVLVLTTRDALQDKVDALDAGADDYLTKPFALEELVARLRALARRTDPQRGPDLRAGDLSMDVRARRVWRGAIPVDLTPREFALLEQLLRHPDQVLSRDELLAAVWGNGNGDRTPTSNVVDVCVRSLRRKIDRPDEPSLIATVRGRGYRLDPLPDGP